ncbi:hypothetical protein MN116_005765 [Schistosoma mekongi]|uniref:Antigen KI-67 n=1 Tax=Schistosoma mekongi TaxID=38744 RepID=A0AAE2D3U7_SCHME|nr:hypothetical protein MN116_005765 [Schistosoma mekongi]
MNPSGHIVVIRRDGTDGLTCDWCSPLCDIGSNQSCDIRVQHSTVAPFHCTLQLMGNGLVQAVSRVDGKYKMLVNDFPLKDACVLTNNSVLTVGDRQFRFLYPSIRKVTTGDYLCETPRQIPIYHGKEEILTPNSLPVVYPSKRSSSKRNPPNSAVRSPRHRSATPKRTLGTSERYGPVPPRQPATPPIIQVLRHESNSSQAMHPSQFQTENEELTKQNATHGCYVGMEASKSQRLSNQPKSCTISNLPISTSPPSSKPSSSIKVDPHDHIQTSVTPSLPNDRLDCTTKKNSSPGFRKSFHKLLILNESSKHSKLCDVDQFCGELSCVQQHSIENQNLPSNEQRNQLFYSESLNNFIEKGSRDSIPEILISPNSSITTRKSSVNSPRKIDVACSLETGQRSDYRGNKRTIVDKIYSVADDKPTSKRRRGVSFGPPLSPEQFDKSLPPSTPVKRGETPLAKLSHSTPASHNLQTTPVVPRQATPYSSKAKLSQISQLSIFSETTLESPNHNATNNRVSAVISLPPTPDTNLLNSLSANSSYPSASVAAYPVTSTAYSAPIKSSINRMTFKRRSLRFGETPDNTPSPKVPPTSPVSNRPVKRHHLEDQWQNTNQLGKRARSLHFPIYKPNTNTTNKKHYTSVPDLTLKEQSTKCRGRPSSVPPTQLSETEPSTPNRSLLSASKSSGLTGVRKMMRTPKTLQTPRVSGVSELFDEESIGKRRRGRPSSVPPTQLSETEPSTPNRSLLSASKSSGLTGVRKMMRTPKTLQTLRVSGVSELFVEESIGKRRRGRPSSVPPTQLSETEPSTPNRSLLSASKSSGLTGVRKMMRTPKTLQTPRVSGVSELFVEESIGKRRRGRPSSVPPTQLSETEPSTPNRILLSASKSSGLTGVRKMMRTPKTLQTPRVSGVSELFVEESIGKRRRGRPSSVPPTQLSETEPSTPNRSLLSASKSSGLTGVRKMMRTPKTLQTPRVSGVSELFVEESIGKRRRGRPSSVPPTQLSETEPSTPNRSLLSASKSSGLTGVRKMMRTPKTLQTPRVSGVSELFVEESIGKRRRGRPSSVPPTQLSETEPSTPNRSLLSASKSSGLTGVRKMMRTPKTLQTPRVSGVSELFVEESIGKRRRGRPSSVPPTQLSETEPSTPNRSLLSASKSSGLTGVRKMMRTPKTLQTPRVSGVSELFVEESIGKRRRGRPSSVPPTQLSETEPSTPNRSLLSASKSSGLTGVRKMMRTPKTLQTPRVSGVSELFVEESIGKRRRGRPSSVPPTQLSETEPSTPNRSLLSASKSSGLTGVRKMMRTPKTLQTPRVSGVSELFVEESIGKRRRGRPSSVPPTQLSETEPSTPNRSLLSASKSSGLTGVRKMMRTPKTLQTPRVSGVSELFVEESIGKRRRGRPSSVPPTQLSETEPSTPNRSLLSASKSSGLTGVRKMMRTPKTLQTPRVSGVSELFVEESIGKRRRGRPSSVPPTQLSETEPSTPNRSLLSASKSSGLTGVRKMMRTPKTLQTPRVSGVSELFVEESIGKRRRGRPSSVPPTQLSETEPSTPNRSLLSASKSSGLTGVRKMMRTPKTLQTPRVSGVSELFVEESIGKRRRGRPSSVPPTQLSETEPSTPNRSLLSASKSSGLTGVRKMMRTPKTLQTPRVSGVSELFVEESIGKRRRGRPSSVPPTQLSETEPSTPNRSLLSASKSSGLTGVRKMMRTPKTLQTPRVSGVSELFVEESIGKRRRGRPSSVPPTQLSETEPSTPNRSLLSASKSSGLTGVRKMMRTPKTLQTPRVSGVSELFVEESIGKRRRGRPSSVPPTQLSETEPSTPNRSLLSASKSSGLTGVRKMMRTPKTLQTPRVSGVSELFVEESIGKRRRGRPSSVPPTQLSETEPSTPNRSLLSASKSSGLTGVRKMMRTPKTLQTPRVSGVSELFVEESIGKRRRGRPSSVPPTQLSETEPSTPNRSLLSASKSSGLTGVRKMMRTPKTLQTPRVSGVSELFVEESIGKRRRGRPSSVPPTQLSETEPSTPNRSLLSASKSSGLTGVRKMMRTPKTLQTPRVSGVSELFVEESIGKRRRGRPSSVPPTQLSETEPSTPNRSLLSASKSSGLTGVRKMMRTPKTLQTPRVSGVSELFVEESIGKRRRGRPSSVPPTQLSETEPSTPNRSLLSASKSSGLTGVRKMMRTPKTLQTPRVSGVSELFVEESIGKRRRGRPSSVPPTQLSETEPSTPNRSLLSASKSSGLTGVRKMMRTPKTLQTPRVSGVSELFVEESIGKRRRGRPSSVPPTQLSETEPSTPNRSLLSASKSSGLTGVRKMMRTPKTLQTPRVSGVSELFVGQSSRKRRRGCALPVESVIVGSSTGFTDCRVLVSTDDVVPVSNVGTSRCLRRRVVDLNVSLFPSNPRRRGTKIPNSPKSLPGITRNIKNPIKLTSSKDSILAKRNRLDTDKRRAAELSTNDRKNFADDHSVTEPKPSKSAVKLTSAVPVASSITVGNRSRRKKRVSLASEMTPGEKISNVKSLYLKTKSNEQSQAREPSMSNESNDTSLVLSVPVATRVRNRIVKSDGNCMSSSRPQRGKKVSESAKKKSVLVKSTVKRSEVQTSIKVTSVTDISAATRQSKNEAACKNKLSTSDLKYSYPPQGQLISVVKSSNNRISKKSTNRLSEVHKASSFPAEKRLRRKIVQLGVERLTSEQIQDGGETSLYVKKGSIDKKSTIRRANMLRNHESITPTASVTESSTSLISKDLDVDKIRAYSRRNKRPSVISVDNVARVSPKRRTLRSHKLITSDIVPLEMTSQLLQESLSMSKTTRKKQTRANTSSVLAKSSKVKITTPVRQTRSRLRQISHANK